MDYVASTVEGLQEKVDAARAALSATTQEEIDAATQSLREARLTARTKADKSALREMIAYVNSLDFSAYSDINSLRAAMFNAEQTMADEEATQEEVNAAKEALEAELKALTPKKRSIDRCRRQYDRRDDEYRGSGTDGIICRRAGCSCRRTARGKTQKESGMILSFMKVISPGRICPPGLLL